MKRIVSVAIACGIISLGAVAYAKGGIKSNANSCFVTTAKEYAASNTTGKPNYLRDVSLDRVALCTEQRNSAFQNMFFDRAEIGRYVRVGSAGS